VQVKKLRIETLNGKLLIRNFQNIFEEESTTNSFDREREVRKIYKKISKFN